jgi:hypothetical protein
MKVAALVIQLSGSMRVMSVEHAALRQRLLLPAVIAALH